MIAVAYDQTITPESIRAKKIDALAKDVEDVVHKAIRSNNVRYIRQHDGYFEYYSDGEWHRTEGEMPDINFVTEDEIDEIFNNIFGGNVNGTL